MSKPLPHENVYVRLGKSEIHGIGVFAIRPIPKGTDIFANDRVDLVWVDFDEAKQLDLPTITKVVIQEVEARIAGGFAPYLPVPFFWEKHGSFVREEL